MRHDYKIKVGMEEVSFGFDAADMNSKPSAPSGAGSPVALKTLTLMTYDSDSVYDFESMIDAHGGCQMMEDEPSPSTSSSSGMSWGSSSSDEE